MFHLFAGQKYYPQGGAEDHVASAEKVEQLLAELICFFESKVDDDPSYGCSGLWAHITDSEHRLLQAYSAPDAKRPGEWTDEPTIRAVRELIQEELDRLVQRLLAEKW